MARPCSTSTDIGRSCESGCCFKVDGLSGTSTFARVVSVVASVPAALAPQEVRAGGGGRRLG